MYELAALIIDKKPTYFVTYTCGQTTQPGIRMIFRNFFLFPHTFQDDVFAINYLSIAFPMKQFSFKFILRVIV